ncbi:hypothetical protein JR316_0012218 [Psilocybe cubensis]|nr:hypothetical protein JR316_0012218 [Psilocybe cubensis]KAH9475107.1 hypothetical protein JR316_0012218 [Psilocybe cubensis]
MSWTILSPEFVITWAGRQWIGARRIAREQGWTVTHGHFLQMGGFMLYKGDEKKGVLSYERFKMLLNSKRIEFPKVSREEIEDRSKSDGLCKALVVGQTSWFVLQCIARRISHLPITELELATLAFAALNGCMYFCWWDKPFDVRIPIPVQLLSEESEEIIQDSRGVYSFNLGPAPLQMQSPNTFPEIHQVQWVKTLPTALRTFFNTRLDAINDLQFVAQFAYFNNPNRPEDEVGPMQVPAFYALLATNEEYNRIFLAVSATGTIFGAIHCAGWSFHFPTAIELWLWRTCAVSLVVGPLFLLFVSYEPLNDHFQRSRFSVIRLFGEFFANDRYVKPLGWLYYILVRVALLAECFAALRDLPSASYSVVQWPLFLPHI